jgi:TolB-like protein
MKRYLKSFGRSAFLTTVLMASVALGACDTVRYTPAFKGADFRAEQNETMAHYSYKAADIVIDQSRFAISGDTPLLIGTLTDVDQVETSNTFGRMVAEQVAARFVQQGYSVSELKLRNSVNIQNAYMGERGAGEFLLSRDVESVRGEHKAAAVVTGTYAVASGEVLVNLRMMDVGSGTIIASTDYVIPRDADVDALLDDGRSGSFFGGPLQY